MDVTIRLYEPKDASRVSALIYKGFKNVYGDLLKDDPKPESYWNEVSHSKSLNTFSTAFVAESNGIVIGYIRATVITNRDLGILEVVGVDPDASAKGVGRALFEAAENIWKESKVRKVYTCTSHINPALNYYLKMGFVEEGRLKSHFYPGVDEIQLGKFYV